jgi:hypothetical protein
MNELCRAALDLLLYVALLVPCTVVGLRGRLA